MNAARLVLCAMVVCLTGPATGEPRFSTQQITRAEWQELYERTKKAPGASLRRKEWQVLITAPGPRYISTYVFTRPGHPAHPAVVIHDVLEMETGHAAELSSYYAGPKTQFDAWVKRFRFTAYALYPPSK